MCWPCVEYSKSQRLLIFINVNEPLSLPKKNTLVFFLLHECYIFEFLFMHTDCILICSNEMKTVLRRYLKP